MKFSLPLPIVQLVPMLKEHKKKILILLFVSILTIFAILAWRHYHFKQSPQKTLQDISQALQKGNRPALAMLVDFRTLSESFAQQILQNAPPDSHLPTLEILAETVQQRIFDSFTKVEEKKDAPKPLSSAPLDPLPADAMPQISTSLHLEQANASLVLARATVDYPRAEKKFILIFQLEKKPSTGWQLTKIVNAAELVNSFLLSQQSIDKQKAIALAEKNAQQQKRMHAQLVVNSCTAVAGMLSDGKTALLNVEILAQNPGPHGVMNFNVEVQLTGKKHPSTPHSFLLNLAKHTLQGETLTQTWNITLDLQKPEHVYLLAEKNLQCSTRFNNMVLSSGEVLFLRKNTH
ncbi:MAG: DUF2939 domain-containing protein [Desulfovibrionaceae bacterium]